MQEVSFSEKDSELRCAKLYQSSRQERVLCDNVSYFSSKPYVVNPHLNCLVETFQMRGHIICLYAELTQSIPNYHQNAPSYLELCCYNIGDIRVVKYYKDCSRRPYSAEVVSYKSGPVRQLRNSTTTTKKNSMSYSSSIY